MRGDATLFTRWDAVEAAWEAVTPILNRWAEHARRGLSELFGGQPRAASADALLVADGREWRKI